MQDAQTARWIRDLAARASGNLANQVPWRRLIEAGPAAWDAIQPNGKRVLIATVTGGHAAIRAVEGTLAAALTLRGAEVHALLCDEVLPACLECQQNAFPEAVTFATMGPQNNLCVACYSPALRAYTDLDVTVHTLGRLLSSEARERATAEMRAVPLDQVPGFRRRDVAIGEHAMAGALRFFARGGLLDDPVHKAVLRRFLLAALLTQDAIDRLLDQTDFDAVVFNHGIYVPHGILGEVIRRRGGRVVNWAVAYRKQSFIFSHGDTYHHTLISEPVETWTGMRWSEAHEKAIVDYLKSRWTGSGDWVWFFEKPVHDLGAITASLGLDLDRPTIGLLTNVFWDAQLHYPRNVFDDMLQWILETIAWFAERPDLQLLIRVHPAEIRGTLPSRQPIVEEIAKVWPKLPANVVVVPPEADVSTYPLMLACNAALIYGTKMGTELTSMGIPVIVAGEAWIRGKGVTHDARDRAHYFELLGRLPFPGRLDAETVARARRYAYHFFFRRMIPWTFMEDRSGRWPPFMPKLDTIADLAPGRDAGLDLVCDGILDGTPFVHPAENLMLDEQGGCP